LQHESALVAVQQLSPGLHTQSAVHLYDGPHLQLGPQQHVAPATRNKHAHNNNNLRLFDCRHAAQSNTTNIHHTGRDTQQPSRRAALGLYTEGLSGKWQAANGAQRLINHT